MDRFEIFYILYFFIYSFLGWMLEVSLFAAVKHRLVNRGLSNLPFCFSYGFTMLLLIMGTNENTTHGFKMFILSVDIVAMVEILGGFLSKKLVHRRLWDYRELLTIQEPYKTMLNTLIIAFGFFTCLKLVHPFIFVLVRLLPAAVRTLVNLLLCASLLGDMLFSLRLALKRGGGEEFRKLQNNIFSSKKNLGRRIANFVIHQLDWKEEVVLEAAGAEGETLRVVGSSSRDVLGDAQGTRVFASGLCFEKAIWIMIFCGLLGNVCETLLVHYQTGIWMRRGSLVFIPISLVWGVGGVFMTLLLEYFAQGNGIYIFLVGFLFGGAYEYLCSIFTETFLGTRFWDYHNMPFNIDGRTNLLFMFIWGLMAYLWIKLAYPWISSLIEGVAPSVGMAATWIVTLLLTIDILLTGVVILRSYFRHEGMKASNFVEEYIDENYSDEIVKRNWRNIRFGPNAPDSQ